MPRAARIDVPDVLQHVIVRGIEKRYIFPDDDDRMAFVQRLGRLLLETRTQCLAWSLMSNHFHLLVKPTEEKLSNFMRRLLTGYAVTFNLSHCRSGHLFQNRYKSIVCEEEPYLLELVRYIHLNPLRAGLVSDLRKLDVYPWSGHSALVGNYALEWQDVGEVLGRFGQGKKARRCYRQFVMDGVDQGSRKELVGGGLKRVLATGVDEEPVSYDERVLGSGTFVQNLVDRHDLLLHGPALSLSGLVKKVAATLEMTPEEIRGPGRSGPVAEARSIISYLGYRKLGYSGEEVARELGITRSGVCKRTQAGEELVRRDERLRRILES